MENIKEELKNKFSDKPRSNYVETVVDRFQENMKVVDSNKKVFENVMTDCQGVKVGYRFQMDDGLYEVTMIQQEPRHDEPRVTIAKVLDTKVSEAFGNVHGIDISTLLEAPEFESYNNIVDEVYEYTEN